MAVEEVPRQGEREKPWPPWLAPVMGWSAVALLVLGVLATGYWFLNRREEDDPFKRYGNLASVLGVLFGLSALAFTVWTVVETQKVEDAARKRERDIIERAGKEIEHARVEITAVEQRWQQTVEGIAYRDLRQLCEKTAECLQAGARAIQRKPRKDTKKKWRDADKELTDAGLLCVQLSNFAQVTVDEKQSINIALGDLDATLRVLRRESQGMEAPQSETETETAQSEEEARAEDEESVQSSGVGAARAETAGPRVEDLVEPVQRLMRLVVGIGSRAAQSIYR